MASHKAERADDPTPTYKVSLGDRGRVVAQGMCKSLKMSLGDYTIVLDGYLFSLDGVDMVLDMAWLKPFGEVQED